MSQCRCAECEPYKPMQEEDIRMTNKLFAIHDSNGVRVSDACANEVRAWKSAFDHYGDDAKGEGYTCRAVVCGDAETSVIVPVVKWRRDGSFCECPCCGSLDIGGASDIVHCYVCGLSVQVKGAPLKEAMNKWNTRGGKLLSAGGDK